MGKNHLWLVKLALLPDSTWSSAAQPQDKPCPLFHSQTPNSNLESYRGRLQEQPDDVMGLTCLQTRLALLSFRCVQVFRLLG